MKQYDFGYYFSNFLNKYLPGEYGLSTNTIASYEDTFAIFLTFMSDSERIKVERLRIEDLTRARVEKFLLWLKTERGNSPQTRNVRLAAIHTFAKYLQYEVPRLIGEWQAIIAIDAAKKPENTPCYASVEGIKLILAQPNAYTKHGRRDLAMLSLMYDTGARVSEICDLTPNSVRIATPSTLKIIGKGNKARVVPLQKEQTEILEVYMREKNLLRPENGNRPLFTNAHEGKLTRSGVAYILNKYIESARTVSRREIPENFSCHSMRHSKAMHMLQGDVPLIYIRDILGHKSVITTEVYARVDGKKKREAIEAAYNKTTPDISPAWHSNSARNFIAGLKHT